MSDTTTTTTTQASDATTMSRVDALAAAWNQAADVASIAADTGAETDTAEAEETATNDDASTTDDGTDPESAKQKPDETDGKTRLSADLAARLAEADRDYREAARLTRQAREKVALAEQRERQASEITEKWGATSKALERLRGGDLSALSDLGVSFETLQQAALADPPSPKVLAVEAELAKLRDEIKRRDEAAEQARVAEQQRAALAAYQSDLSRALGANEVCAEYPDEAMEIAMDAQRRYVARVGSMVDADELVAYTAEQILARAKRYSSLASKLAPAPVANPAQTRARSGVVPAGTTKRAAEQRPAPRTAAERVAAIMEAMSAAER